MSTSRRPLLIPRLLFLLTMSSLAVAAIHSEPMVLSVLEFTDNSADPGLSWLSAGIADMLITDLSAAELLLVNRSDLNAAMAEQSLALAGITDDTALVIGRMVRADALLTGAYALAGGPSTGGAAAGGVLRIDARITDVDSGKIIAAVSATGPPAAIFALEAALARDICVALSIAPPAGLGDIGTASLPAARAYYEGVKLQDSGDVQAAKLRFQESARLDPLYAKPRYSLEESWQLLKDFRALRQQREVNALWRKAEALRRRLAGVPFIGDAEAIMAAYTAGSPTVQTGTPPKDDPTLGSCPTPAVCLWNLQITYWEIGNQSMEYFQDEVTEEAALKEITGLARQAEAAWPVDEWLPEILYWEVMAYRWLGDWEKVRSGCERFFIEWPDFRMSWALEDMYEAALTELEG